ncbi:MAG: D-alanine--D-alanine ligase family protein, partial [Thermoanaerobaculia bacterium]
VEPTLPPVEEPARGRKKGRRKPRRPLLDREEVHAALTQLGHEPSYFALEGRPASLAALARVGADLIFNLSEAYGGDDTKDMNIAAFLDLVGKPYTGAGPRALHLAQDKGLAKKVLSFHGIKTPNFAVAYRGALDHAHDIHFPLIVKPAAEDGSIGIDAGAVVTTVKELMERLDYIQGTFDCPALVEEYVEGREIYAAVLGNGRPEALPLIELDLSGLPEGVPRIAGSEVKWEIGSEVYKKTKSAVAKDLDEDTAAAIQKTAVGVYQALKLRDYGRIDLRLTAEGEIYVIEANPNPWIASGAEFALAARESGRSYTQLIGEIVDLARARTA